MKARPATQQAVLGVITCGASLCTPHFQPHLPTTPPGLTWACYQPSNRAAGHGRQGSMTPSASLAPTGVGHAHLRSPRTLFSPPAQDESHSHAAVCSPACCPTCLLLSSGLRATGTDSCTVAPEAVLTIADPSTKTQEHRTQCPRLTLPDGPRAEDHNSTRRRHSRRVGWLSQNKLHGLLS